MVGIEISPLSVKLLELSAYPQGYRVESYAVEPLPIDAVQEKEIKNVEVVGMAIERVVKRSRTRTKYAAIAVAGSAVITKVIQMNSSLSEHELAAQIPLEAERNIPYPLSEVNLDFQILGTSTKNAEVVDVLLAASRSEIIDTLVETLRLGGLIAKVVDTEAYAIERAFSLIADQLPGAGLHQIVAVMDIGATTTAFSVLKDRVTIYTREQQFGGKQLTEEIQRRYDLTFEEANLVRRQGGLPEDYQAQVIVPFKEAVIQQANRSLQFFFSSTPFTKIDHLVLAGETASLPGLVEKLEERLSISTSLANPLADMTIAPRVSVPHVQADAAALMICSGLALRSFTS